MADNHVDEAICRAVQERVGYTEEQFELFKKLPLASKISRPDVVENLIRTTVIFEVVESRNCNIQHAVGDKFYFNAEGYMITRKCPEKVCPAIMPVMTRMIWLVQERIYEGLDPRPTFYFGDCDDVGIECGGMGKVRLETKITQEPV